MSFFSFGKKRARSVALVDIGSASVGGAYAHFIEGKQPVIHYTARVNVESRDGEVIGESMLRSLSILGKLLTEEGAPALHRAVGSAHVHEVLASVAAPWQESAVSRVRIEPPQPFVFTHANLRHALDAAEKLPKDRIESGRTVIATLLNGYETAHPFGKRVKRADLITLHSSLDKEIAAQIETALRHTFHTGNISITAFAPVAYSVLRDLYPHQKDFIVLDVSGTGTDAVFVKKGLIEGVYAISYGTHDLIAAAQKVGRGTRQRSGSLLDQSANDVFEKASETVEETWLEGLRAVFEPFAAEQALPRTIFLLADNGSREYMKRMLEKSTLRSLWLSQDPLTIIPVVPAHIAASIATRGIGEADIFLSLLALYARTKDGFQGPEQAPLKDPAA